MGVPLMNVYIESKILEFDNDKIEIENILGEIEKEVAKTSKVLNSMIVDGYEIFNDYYDYFLENIRSIEKVEVILLTYKELVNETLISTLDYLRKTPDLIKNLASYFYKNPDEKSWCDLNDLLEGISWIISTFSLIDNDRNLNNLVINHESWNLYSKEIIELSKIIPDFKDALNNQDNVAIADILSYEIQPKFNELAEKLSELVTMEEIINDFN